MQIGFFVALVAEAVAPQHSQGLFGGLDNTAASVFAAHGVVLITFSAVRADLSLLVLSAQQALRSLCCRIWLLLQDMTPTLSCADSGKYEWQEDGHEGI